MNQPALHITTIARGQRVVSVHPDGSRHPGVITSISTLGDVVLVKDDATKADWTYFWDPPRFDGGYGCGVGWDLRRRLEAAA